MDLKLPVVSWLLESSSQLTVCLLQWQSTNETVGRRSVLLRINSFVLIVSYVISISSKFEENWDEIPDEMTFCRKIKCHIKCLGRNLETNQDLRGVNPYLISPGADKSSKFRIKYQNKGGDLNGLQKCFNISTMLLFNVQFYVSLHLLDFQVYLIFCHTTSFAKFSDHLIIELWSPVCTVSVAHLSDFI